MTMWHEFDALAARMKLSMSGLLAKAAAEYVENHRHDPSPEKPVPNDRRRRRIDHDPFDPKNEAKLRQKGSSF